MKSKTRPIEEKINECLDVKIKNLHPMFREELYNILLSNPKIANDVAKSKRFIVDKYKFSALGIHTKVYWLSRGWSEGESIYKSKQSNNRKKCSSPFSMEFWLEKINPNTGTRYTETESDYKRNSQRPIRKEYWLELGHSEQESIELAVTQKYNNNKYGAKASGGRDKELQKSSSKRCKEYYMLRGFTEEESIDKVFDVQLTFSKDICIEKYGKEKGNRVWKDRQDNWQKTLNSKPQEEIERINKAKIYNGYKGISKAEKEIVDYLKYFYPAIETQYVLKGENGYYVYDIKVGNKLIEYNGDYWHCNPNIYDSDFIRKGKSSSEIWSKDNKKTMLAEKFGYTVYTIWEQDYKTDKNKVMDLCKDYLIQ